MAHPRHVHVPGGIYLTSSIVEHGRAAFVDDGERAALGELMGHVMGRCGAQIHAYKWLPDELLMMVQVYGVSLSGVMQRIIPVHARRVNEKSGYRGNLFQHPHRAVLLEDRGSVLEAFAAVHRNPPSAWSSHRAYLGLEEVPWLTKRMIMDLLSPTPEGQVGAYAELMARQEAWKLDVRPHRGDAPRARHSRAYDEFHTWLKFRSVECAKPASLDELIQAVARWLQLAPEAIESDSTSPLLSFARGFITWAAMQNRIASLTDVARRFDRGRSTLHETRETYRSRAPQLFNIRLTEILAGPAIAVSEVLRLIGAVSEDPTCPQK